MSAFNELRKNEHEVRRGLIIDAVMELFADKSFHEIGMREIASSVGISAAAIYRYFPSQDDLFVEALSRELAIIQQKMKEWSKGKIPSVEELAIAVVDYLLDNEAVFHLLSHFMIKRGIDSEIMKKYKRAMHDFLDSFDHIFEKKGVTENVYFISRTFFASLTGIVLAYRNLEPDNIKEEDSRKLIHEFTTVLSTALKTRME